MMTGTKGGAKKTIKLLDGTKVRATVHKYTKYLATDANGVHYIWIHQQKVRDGRDVRGWVEMAKTPVAW